jgi:hypothetical protein
MPNWCNNTVEISHPDTAKMYALVEAINEGKFCNFAIPVPQELHIVAGRVGDDSNPDQIALVEAEARNKEKYGFGTWYDFCVNQWGTKWDVDPYEPVEYDDQHDKHGITFGFDSAWSPPTGCFEALVEQGYSVRAYYYESGMCFAGVWEDGDDDFYELGSMSSQEVRDTLPEALDEMMGISETIANYEEEEDENE